MSTTTKLIINKNNLSTDSTVNPQEWYEGLNAGIRQIGTSQAMECAKLGAGLFGANHQGIEARVFVPMVLPLRPLPVLPDEPTAAQLKLYESTLDFNNAQKNITRKRIKRAYITRPLPKHETLIQKNKKRKYAIHFGSSVTTRSMQFKFIPSFHIQSNKRRYEKI